MSVFQCRTFSEASASHETALSTEWGAPRTAPQELALIAAQPYMRAMIDLDHQFENWSQFDRGGQSPPMESPDLLVGDVRDFFRNLR
jgi:epoxide hydrolase